MESDNPTIEEIENIVAERQKKSEEENKTAHENNEKARLDAEEKLKAEEEKLRYTNRDFSTDDFLNNIFSSPSEDIENDASSSETPSSKESVENSDKDNNQ